MNAISVRTVQNGAALAVGLVVFWQLLYWVVGDVAFRSPVQTVRFTAELLVSESFWPNALETMRAFALVLVLSFAIGLSMGTLLGLNGAAGAVLEPLLVASYAIPKVTLYPILLLMFGLGLSAKIAFRVIHGVIPIALFTVGAVRHIRPVLLKTGRVMELGPLEMVLYVLLPVGFSLKLIGVILVEIFASHRGLGFLLINVIKLHNVDLIMALTCLLSVFAKAASFVLLIIDRACGGGWSRLWIGDGLRDRPA